MKKRGSRQEPKKYSGSDSFIFADSDSSKKPLTVRFSENTREIIDKLAEDNGISKAKVVRRLLKRELKNLRGADNYF